MKKLLIVIAVIILAAAGGAGYVWWGRPPAEVFAVRLGPAVSAVYGTVKVQPAVKMMVRARNSGIVRLAQTKVSADIIAGMDVQEGWPLARIESPELDREVSKVETDLKVGTEKARLGPPSMQMLKTAEASLGRLEKLAELRNAPASEVEKARNDVQSLRERVKTEQLEIDRTMTALREQVSIIYERKGRCEIKSPMNGVLAAVNVVSGDLVAENTPLFLVCTRNYFLEGYVNEEDVGSLKKEMRAVVRLYSYPQKDFGAVLTDIIPSGENQRYVVRLSFETPPENLMAGMTGEMNVILGQRPNALVIPTRALMADHVFVVNNGSIEPRVVKIGLRSLERTEVVQGLKEGDLVVVADHDSFRVGQWVRPIQVNR